MRNARSLWVFALVGLLAVSATAVMAEKPQRPRPPNPPANMQGFDLTIQFTPGDRAFLSKQLDRPLDDLRQNINVPILLHNVDGLPEGRKLLQPGILGNVQDGTFEASGDNPFRCWLIRPAADYQEVSLFLAHCLVAKHQRNVYSAPGGGQIQMEGVQILSHSVVHPGASVDINADTVGPSIASAVALLRQQYDGPIEIIGQSMEKISISSQ